MTLTVESSNQSIVSNNNISVNNGGNSATVVSGINQERSLSIIPELNQSGEVTITITVEGSGTQVGEFTLNVLPVNDPPVISNLPAILNQNTNGSTLYTGQTAIFNFNVDDVDNLLGECQPCVYETDRYVCECGEIFSLVYRNDVAMREGTIKKCKECRE